MSKYKIIVFDLDGTLVNSLQDLANAANEGLKKAGLPTHDAESYRKFVGNGREVLFEKAMGDCRDPEKFRIVNKDPGNDYVCHLAEFRHEGGKLITFMPICDARPADMVFEKVK